MLPGADVPAEEILQIASLTLQVTLAATLLSAAIGVPLGALLALRPGRSRSALRALVYTFYGLPPVVAGLLVYLLLSRTGPLGGLGLLFTPAAMVVAETLLAAPLVAGLTLAAIAEIPAPVRETVRSAGAGGALATWTLLKEARYGVLAGVMVGFGRSLSEVAAAVIVGGNVRHETRTLGTAILQEVNQGNFTFALVLGALLLLLALLTFLALARLQRAGKEAPR